MSVTHLPQRLNRFRVEFVSPDDDTPSDLYDDLTNNVSSVVVTESEITVFFREDINGTIAKALDAPIHSLVLVGLTGTDSEGWRKELTFTEYAYEYFYDCEADASEYSYPFAVFTRGVADDSA